MLLLLFFVLHNNYNMTIMIIFLISIISSDIQNKNIL